MINYIIINHDCFYKIFTLHVCLIAAVIGYTHTVYAYFFSFGNELNHIKILFLLWMVALHIRKTN